MQVLDKQTFVLALRQLEQKKGSKFIQGMLTVAENTVQRETDVYSKRDGYLAMDTNTVGPAITIGVDIGTTGDSLVMRTKTDFYQRAESQQEWLHRGPMRQFAMSVSEVGSDAGRRPTICVDMSNKLWCFWGDATSRWYSVIEHATGVTIVPPTKFSTGTTGGLRQGRAMTWSGHGSIWFFYQTGSSENILLAKFDMSNPSTAPTQTTYATVTGGTLIEAWDAVRTSANTVLVGVVGNATISGVGAGFHVSRLNTATGLPDASGWVTQGAAGAYTGPGSFCANATGSADGNVYFLSRVGASSTIAHHQVTVSGLVITFTDIGNGGVTFHARGGIVASRQTNGDKWIYTTDANNADTGLWLMHRRVYVSGGSHTASVFRRGHFSVSYPWQLDGNTYLVSGCESHGRLDRAYYLLDGTNGRIVGRTLYGFGGDPFQRAGVSLGTDRGDYGHHTQVVSSLGTDIFMPVNTALTDSPLGAPNVTRLIKWEMNPVLGPPVTGGGVTLVPGSWPMAIIGKGAFSEPAPTMLSSYSHAVVGAGGTLATGNYGSQVLYKITDDQGTVIRSGHGGSAAHVVSVANSVVNLTIRTLRNLNQNERCNIEVYFTAKDSTTLRLQGTIQNDQSVDTVVYTVTAVPSVDAETIYTDGSPAPAQNAPPPPCRWAASWRERMFVGHTDVEGEVWCTHVFEPGMMPRWSLSNRFTVRDGTGPTYAGGAVDFNSFAIFKQDGAWIISGPGPDIFGASNYTPVRVYGAPGCSNPRSVVTVPGVGLLYQAHGSGEIWAITPGLEAKHIGSAVQSHRSSDVMAAVLDPFRKQAVFVTAGVRNLVCDYGHGPDPVTGAPVRWSTEVPSGASAWTGGVAAAYQSSGFGFFFLQSDGFVQAKAEEVFADNGQPIVQRVRIAPAHPAGIMNWQRVYRGQVMTEYRGAHSLVVTYDTNYGTANGGTSETFPPKVVSAAGSPVFEFRPVANKRPSALEVEITESGANLTEGFTFEQVAFEVGVKRGLPRVESARKL